LKPPNAGGVVAQVAQAMKSIIKDPQKTGFLRHYSVIEMARATTNDEKLSCNKKMQEDEKKEGDTT
jgi:hypothetical protein